MKYPYIERNFNRSSRELISQAQAIIEEYQAQGYSLTVRQLYYQFVARGFLENRQENYKRLGSIISDARLAGLISWRAIVDRTRSLRGINTQGSPEEVVRDAADRYAVDRWTGQDYRPEVWIEKDALVGVIEGVCSRYRVNFFSCRGYTSQSSTWEAGQRLEQYAAEGQIPIIIHLGDHDPSGIDMTRDIDERLALFSNDETRVRRIALSMA